MPVKMSTGAEAPELAMAWKEACKHRNSLTKYIDRLMESNTSANDKKIFDKVEDSVAKFRLSCMQIIFADFVYATENHVQRDLWETQLHVGKLYRSVIRDSRGQHIALRRIEKRYASFLNLCQLFYEGYIQRLAKAYDLPVLTNVARRINPNDKGLGSEIQPSDISPELFDMVTAACHDSLIALGDLARYHLKLKGKMALYEAAVSFYNLANDLSPALAYGHHGIGLASVEVNKHFLVVYHMYRAVVAEKPHPNAMNNLATEFSHLRDPNASLLPKDPPPSKVLKIIFVRLHAYFYAGNGLPRNGELEQSFFRRLEEVLQTITVEGFLDILHMAIINVSALSVAKQKLSDPKGKPLFYENVFAFNCKFAGYFAWVFTRRMYATYTLESNTDSENKNKQELGAPANTNSPFILDAAANISLRVMRFYSAWLLSSKIDIVDQIKNFEKAVTNFTCEMARGLTTLTFFFQSHLENFARSHGGILPICKYLMEEDDDIVQCPAMGQAAIHSLVNSPITEKPRGEFADYREKRDSSWIETLSRVSDILTSSQQFATDSLFPLTYAVLPGSQLVYAVDDKVLTLSNEFDMGTGPSSKFPVCVSVIEARNAPKSLEPTAASASAGQQKAVGVSKKSAAAAARATPSTSGPSVASQKVTGTTPEVSPPPQDEESVPVTNATLASLPKASDCNDSFQSMAQSLDKIEQFDDDDFTPTHETVSTTNLAVETDVYDEPVVATNSSPITEHTRRLQSLEWSSVYTPKPASSAWQQLTADQYYSGPMRRGSQMGGFPTAVSPLVGSQKMETPGQSVEQRQQLLNTLLTGVSSGMASSSSPNMSSPYLQSVTPLQAQNQPQMIPPPGFAAVMTHSPYMGAGSMFPNVQPQLQQQQQQQQVQPRNMAAHASAGMHNSGYDMYQLQMQYAHIRAQAQAQVQAQAQALSTADFRGSGNGAPNPPPGFSSGAYNAR